MNKILPISQAVISVILIALILLQQRGTGISDGIAGRVSSFATRRGAEKAIFIATIIFAVLFAGVSITRIIIN